MPAHDPAPRINPATAERLEAALRAAEAARAEMSRIAVDGRVKALRYATDSAHLLRNDSAPAELMLSLPPESWRRYLERMVESASAPALGQAMADLLELPREQAVKIFVHADLNEGHFADRAALKPAVAALAKAYAEVTDILPLAELTAAETRDIEALARAAAADPAHPLGAADNGWRAADDAGRIGYCRRVLAAAFPDEDTGAITMMAFSGRAQFLAAYFGTLDAIILGPQMAGDQMRGLHLLAHEYQHRRQKRLVGQLEAGALEPGSFDHARARLFRINLGGGYLSPTLLDAAGTVFPFGAYSRQPVESSAYSAGAAFNRAADALLQRLAEAAKPAPAPQDPVAQLRGVLNATPKAKPPSATKGPASPRRPHGS